MSDFNVLAIDCNDPDAGTRFVTSLHETGFAILKNHPVEPDEISRMYDAWQQFFASETKHDFTARRGDLHGYYGFKSENAKDSAHKDLKEFYHVYEASPVPSDVEPVTRNFHARMMEIGRLLLGWLDQNTPDDVRAGFSQPLAQMVEDSTQNLLRVLHYPPVEDDAEPGEMRAAAHEDINLITLLVTGSEPGLQARDKQGNWHDVPCKAGYITINAGDMLAKASGGYYPSTTHQVVNPPDSANRSRYSMPLFVHPRPDVELAKDLSAGDYLAQRLKEIGLT